jgi:hypothetical protein
MIFNNLSIGSFVSSKTYSDHQLKSLSDKPFDELKTRIRTEQYDFFSQNGFRKLVLSKPTVEIIGGLEISKDISIDVLRSLPNRKDTIQVDEISCLKYQKTDDKINFVLVTRGNHSYDGKEAFQFFTKFVHFDLEKGVSLTDQYDSETQNELSDEEILDKYIMYFLRVITFLELTDVNLEFISGTTTKKRIYSNELKNVSKFDVIHVTSKWNTYTFNINPIDVRGHWRLQPYGTGRKLFKYIWIEPFQKGITRRRPQKELV